MFRKTLGYITVVLFVLLLIYSYVATVLPVVAIKEMMATFKASAGQIGFFNSVVYYPVFFLSLLVGPIVDRWNTRYVGTVVAAIFALGLYYLSRATTINMALGAAVIYGLSFAFTYVLMAYTMRVWLSKRWYAFNLSIANALSNFAAMILSTQFADMLETSTWQEITQGMAWFGFALAACLLVFAVYKKPESQGHSHDIPFALQLKVLLKSREFWKIFFFTIFMFVPFDVIWQGWGVAYLKDALGFSAQQSGLVYACMQGGVMLGVLIFALLADYFRQHKLFLLIGLCISSVLLCVMLYVPTLNVSAASILGFFAGFGLGVFVLCFIFAASAANHQTVGTALALTNMAGYVGCVVFVYLVGKVLDNYWSGVLLDGAHVYSVHGFHVAFAIIPVCYFISFVLAAMLKRPNMS